MTNKITRNNSVLTSEALFLQLYLYLNLYIIMYIHVPYIYLVTHYLVVELCIY